MCYDATIACNPFLVIVVTRICGAWDVCKSKTCDHVGSIMLIMDALMDM